MLLSLVFLSFLVAPRKIEVALATNCQQIPEIPFDFFCD